MSSKAVVLALLLLAFASRGCVPPAIEPTTGPGAAQTDDAVLDAGRTGGRASVSSTHPSASSTHEDEHRCLPQSDVHFFVAPRSPIAGTPLRIVAVAEQPIAAQLSVAAGGEQATSNVRHDGPPYFWIAEVSSPHADDYTARLVQPGCGGSADASLDVSVTTSAPDRWREASSPNTVWPTRTSWSRELEDVYSAWIETLFDAPDGVMPSWSALHEVLRDPRRNLLFDYLGAGEDSVDAPVFHPDCADLPYFLRAYFAFKLGLPFGVSECSRGAPGRPPRCLPRITTNESHATTGDAKASPMMHFGEFVRTVANIAHSGSARIPLDDEVSDYYPVPITVESLRPGTVYADPYGHVLVVAKRLPQTSERGGVLLAVDAQPDGTVRRKRFWRGNFLYATEPELGGVGWKRFRPLSKVGGKLVRWGDAELLASPDYGDVSHEAALSPEAFFDAMDDLLAPKPVDPRRVLLDSIAAIEEQIRTRVDSVDSGREWLMTARAPVAMPGLAELFEATGTWEDLSTPSRDLRLLVAIDFLEDLPAHVARRSPRYALSSGTPPEEEEKALSDLLSRELTARKVAYTRTDGSRFTLSLADVLARKSELEIAYNPNDCAEQRWGAPAGSDEAQTCRSRAPADQQRRMEALRVWFHERRRPPRR
jgi:hypothetical protein